MPPLGRVAGLLGTGYTGVTNYNKYRDIGHDAMTSAALTLIGIDTSADAVPEQNTLKEAAKRAASTYYPLVVGEGIHQAVGSTKGIFGSGIGLKYNASLPKFLKL